MSIVKIKLLVMDVDGTMTDGKINMAESGELFKSFNIKDGYAIHEVLPKYGILSAIITGRISKIVENRASELEVNYVYQGVKNKLDVLRKIIIENKLDFSQVAYIGDDIIDIPCMEVCGVVGCPSDAILEIKNISDFVSIYAGGDGAIREFIDWIISRENM